MSNEAFRTEWGTRFGRSEPKIVCVGRNYHAHATEAGAEAPAAPLLFAKFSNTIVQDGDSILLPAGIGHVDAEAELAVVIGAPARRVSVDDALTYVAGFLCANDVSAREAQYADGQWFRAKGYDTFCPVGPRLVPRDELDVGSLRVQQRLNGEVIQDARTSDLIFSIGELVSYVSAVTTLLPGDLILTGTPEGVGFFRDPKLSLRDGDSIEVEVEGIGVLKNSVHEA